jgi:hypothetical protein
MSHEVTEVGAVKPTALVRLYAELAVPCFIVNAPATLEGAE